MKMNIMRKTADGDNVSERDNLEVGESWWGRDN